MWLQIYSLSGTTTVFRMTDYINYDASYYNNRVLTIQLHSNNRMYFSLADKYSANHYTETPTNFFKLYIWYYIIVTTDY